MPADGLDQPCSIKPPLSTKQPQWACLKITEPDMVECNLWGFKMAGSTNQTVLNGWFHKPDSIT